MKSQLPVHDNFVTRAKRSCHFPELREDHVIVAARADQGQIGHVDWYTFS